MRELYAEEQELSKSVKKRYNVNCNPQMDTERVVSPKWGPSDPAAG